MLRTTTLLIALLTTTSAFAYDPYQQLLNQNRLQFMQEQAHQQQREMIEDMNRFQDQQRLDRLEGEYQTDRLIDEIYDND